MQALVLQAGRAAEVGSAKSSHCKFTSVITSFNLIKKKKSKRTDVTSAVLGVYISSFI